MQKKKHFLSLNLFCSNCNKLCINEEEYDKTILYKYKNFTRTQKLNDYIQIRWKYSDVRK